LLAPVCNILEGSRNAAVDLCVGAPSAIGSGELATRGAVGVGSCGTNRGGCRLGDGSGVAAAHSAIQHTILLPSLESSKTRTNLMEESVASYVSTRIAAGLQGVLYWTEKKTRMLMLQHVVTCCFALCATGGEELVAPVERRLEQGLTECGGNTNSSALSTTFMS
jgi:hypothetical protein